MDYKVLYRKYRPTTFDELVGQNHIKTILKNSITNNKIAHAYMFTGPRGTGKTSTARIFAKALNCLNPKDGISCGECDNCKDFYSSPDVIELDAASNNGVDDIRNIVENVNIAPSKFKYKIYIIDEVHVLSKEGYNAFLKTLEEPPENVIFILATTDIQKVPITILSRCQRFDFQRIDKELIFENLKNICDQEKIKYEEEALKEVSYLSDGCMRDALSILDQISKISNKITVDIIKENFGTVSMEDIDNVYLSIIENNVEELVSLVRKIKKSGTDIKVFINKLLENFIDKAVEIKKNGISNDVFNQLKNIIKAINELNSKISNTNDGYLLLELELIYFINNDENFITARDMNSLIENKIIPKVKIDVKELIDKEHNHYDICDKFIDIRINNTFVNASKDEKIKFSENWIRLKNKVIDDNISEFKTIINKSVPQVVSDTNAIFVTSSESVKLLGNSKLFDFENLFNSINKTEYKMIFISDDNWKEFMATFDKNKNYKKKDESKYILDEASSYELAEDVFGNEKIEIE